ncbi:hypothetical protein AGMMS50222_02130 [Endomicrobiia bacterium]|nr:hypothetical protein AGMMS49556_01990 [Endomicrobiia bacterium]GHT70344.1 hypothetical protein AGMMS49950_05150 [Endomicrobiia bacterium]GHT73891.1 hypothetical protein AGMMS50222_02130 [Endomicrobiia bacterium]
MNPYKKDFFKFTPDIAKTSGTKDIHAKKNRFDLGKASTANKPVTMENVIFL